MIPLLQALPFLLSASGCCETALARPGSLPLPDPPRPFAFSLSGDQRTRLEHLRNQYRAGLDGDAGALVFRTRVAAGLDFGSFMLRVELQDSRAELADSVTGLTTSMVNPLEPLQAHVEIALDGILASGSRSTLRAGRITMDIGRRRLVSRNGFRNTSDGFTGVDWQWTGPGDSRLRAFYTLPVERRVSGNILENNPRLDKEWRSVRFWGVHFSPGDVPWGDEGEAYYFGLNEDDAPGLATTNRHLHTIGVRFHRPSATGGFDYEIESAFQFGRSRASKSATEDLDHVAHVQHVEAGYTFDAPGAPRLQLQYDYASGDRDPADNRNNRFTNLYGSRSFDFGPSGIHGPFARANLSTPGVRLTLTPVQGVNMLGAVRGHWLASSADEWPTAGIGNLAGRTATHIGTHGHLQGGWEPVAGRFRVETGVVHLFAGELMRNAGKDDATYTFVQTILTF